MNILRMVGLASGLILGWVGISSAHDGMPGKDSPKLIYAQGEASQSVPADAVRLIFQFPIEKGSFEEARQTGDMLIEKVRQELSSLQGVKVSIIHSWDLIRQALISWGTKGKKIEHRFAVELEGIAPGKLHEMVSLAIDRSLPVYDKLEMEQIEVYLQEATEEAAKAALYEKAAKSALRYAQGMAQAAGAQLAGTRYLFASSQVVSQTEPERYSRMFSEDSAALRRGIEIRKSFKVRGDVPDELELSVSVVGAFEIQ